jgi:hypothetical protein
MSQHSSSRGTRAVLFVAAFLCSTAAYAGNAVTVRVYGERAWDDAGFATAIGTAAAIIDETGIRASWLDCRGSSLPTACTKVRGSRDLVVRLTPRFVASTAASGEAVRAGDDDANLILGTAVVDRATRLGTLATIFLEHVQAVADRAGVDRASLLGRVLAHEVGHLLQGKTGHSRTGLMREVWTGEELGQNRRDDWSFDLPEQRALRAAVNRR